MMQGETAGVSAEHELPCRVLDMVTWKKIGGALASRNSTRLILRCEARSVQGWCRSAQGPRNIGTPGRTSRAVVGGRAP